MEAREIIRQMEEIERGIVPSCVWFDSPGKVNDDRWSRMSKKDIEQSKRKFRKLYRKACRRFGILHARSMNARQRSMLVRRYISFVSENSGET